MEDSDKSENHLKHDFLASIFMGLKERGKDHLPVQRLGAMRRKIISMILQEPQLANYFHLPITFCCVLFLPFYF